MGVMWIHVQIWGRDQLPRFFHENDAEERALREEFEAAAKAAEDAAAFDQDRTEEEKELRSAVVVAPAPKRVPSLPAKGNLGVCVRPAYGPWTSASHLVQVFTMSMLR